MRKYRLKPIVYVFIIISLLSFLCFSCFPVWKEILDNRKTEVELKEKYNQLLENEETLEDEVVKLQDPEYVAKYAREKYLFTKEGELIIGISEEE